LKGKDLDEGRFNTPFSTLLGIRVTFFGCKERKNIKQACLFKLKAKETGGIKSDLIRKSFSHENRDQTCYSKTKSPKNSGL
jgi:hypothetical protein